MAKKIRKSQEDEVIAMLKREGFRELSQSDIEKEPYKSIYSMPICFEKEKKTPRKNPLSKSKIAGIEG
jgi:hypothetical protein